MGEDDQSGRSCLNLLLLSESEAWTQAATAAARALGAERLESAKSAADAIRRVVRGGSRISHVLLQAGYSDDRVADLIELTGRGDGNAASLIMLGAGADVPARIPTAARAEQHSIERILAKCREPAKTTAQLTPIARLPVHDLSDGLGGVRLHTRYQPIIRLEDRRAVGLEVLARLDHPTLGTIGPDDFVPQLELAGLSRRLTDAVAFSAWHDHAEYLQGLGLFLALNVPLDMLLDPVALDAFDAERRDGGLRAEDVLIELTESQPVASLDAAGRRSLQRAIERLRQRGYGVALDDLGPGVPGIESLLTLPVSTVKLDRNLVVEAARDGKAAGFLRRLVGRAQAAGLCVIAEGVEDSADWERVNALGADMVQGFLVARPLPAAAVRLWLEDWELNELA